MRQKSEKSSCSGTVVSMELRSDEKRLSTRPMGVVSKNDMGAASTEDSSLVCILPEARTPMSVSSTDRT